MGSFMLARNGSKAMQSHIQKMNTMTPTHPTNNNSGIHYTKRQKDALNAELKTKQNEPEKYYLYYDDYTLGDSNKHIYFIYDDKDKVNSDQHFICEFDVNFNRTDHDWAVYVDVGIKEKCGLNDKRVPYKFWELLSEYGNPTKMDFSLNPNYGKYEQKYDDFTDQLIKKKHLDILLHLLKYYNDKNAKDDYKDDVSLFRYTYCVGSNQKWIPTKTRINIEFDVKDDMKQDKVYKYQLNWWNNRDFSASPNAFTIRNLNANNNVNWDDIVYIDQKLDFIKDLVELSKLTKAKDKKKLREYISKCYNEYKSSKHALNILNNEIKKKFKSDTPIKWDTEPIPTIEVPRHKPRNSSALGDIKKGMANVLDNTKNLGQKIIDKDTYKGFLNIGTNIKDRLTSLRDTDKPDLSDIDEDHTNPNDGRTTDAIQRGDTFAGVTNGFMSGMNEIANEYRLDTENKENEFIKASKEIHYLYFSNYFKNKELDWQYYDNKEWKTFDDINEDIPLQIEAIFQGCNYLNFPKVIFGNIFNNCWVPLLYEPIKNKLPGNRKDKFKGLTILCTFDNQDEFITTIQQVSYYYRDDGYPRGKHIL